MVADVIMDFETFGTQPIKDVGAWRYGMDPSCEVLCLAYSLDFEPTKLWVPGDPEPTKLLDAIEDGALVHAWNATFEYIIWNYVQRDWPAIRANQLRCTMALAAYHSLPLGLEKAGAAVKASVQKDKEGVRLLRKFSQPRKPSKNNPSTRIMPEDEPEEFAALCQYCVTDVDSEIAIMDKLPLSELPKREQEIFELDLRINERGVKIDLPTVNNIIASAEVIGKTLEDKAGKIMGGDPPIKTSQRAAVMEWASSEGLEMENYQAGYLRELIQRDDLPKKVHRVLEIREALAKTSITKYDKMKLCAGADGRVRGSIQYYGAQRTGRFAGRLIQVHNLPRGTVGGVEDIAPYAVDLKPNDWLILFDKPMEAFSSLIRSMIITEEGEVFYVADFSNIEGRGVAWLAGQTDVVAEFESGDDSYKHMAASIFGTTYHKVTDDQRFVGKQAVLGCGFGMGPPKFLDTCIGYGQDIGIKLAKLAVAAYRKKNHKVVKFWYAAEEAAKNAIRQPGTVFKCGDKDRISYLVKDGYLWCRLPSGRCLAYHSPRLEDGRLTYMGVSQTTSQWSRQDTYGGKLVENIVQAVARDVMAEAMLRADRAGYKVVMTVHDEIISVSDLPDASVDEFVSILCEVPHWAKGFPVAASGWSGNRYRKD